MANNNPSIPAGDIAFFDNYIPSLESGAYTIQVKTGISGSIDTQQYFENPITQDFEIRGPQFWLPATEAHSVYPPLNSNSAYDQYLPNIVLNKRVLPWERSFDAHDKTIPWLCLLVFKEGEITVNPQSNSALQSSTVEEFLTPSKNVLKPAIPKDSVPPDVLSSTCSSIRISAVVFRALAPKVAELQYLSHVRQVNTGDQAMTDAEDRGWFSVITGNRLLSSTAAAGSRYYVHLVSLEGYYGIMNGDDPWPKKKSAPAEDQDIALASLYNWTFLSQPQKLNFKELVENFAAQSDGRPDNLLLRRYANAPDNLDAATQATLTRLRNGYVPLNYVAPTGETAFAWYRGPLAPVNAQPLPRPAADYHFPSASSLMIYDKDNGIFDHSYAAAWSIGRALALADGTFSQALLNYRKKAYAIIGRLMDALENAHEATQADLTHIINSSVVRDEFKRLISQDVGTTLTEIFRRPLASANDAVSVKKRACAQDNPIETTKKFLAEPAVQAVLQSVIRTDLIPIAQWLARKQLLYDIPFNHLVPDQLALPVEALRFFYIDRNWLDSLVDGAVSVGMQSSKDSFFYGVMRGVINDAVIAETKVMRAKLLGTAASDSAADPKPAALSGIIIRSAVVAGWPGLTVKGFKGDFQSGTQVKTLRMDRLSSNVLLCIFLDIPDTIMLAEPQQGLCFGIEDGGAINLRQLSDPPGKPKGQAFPASGGFAQFFRPVTGGIGANVLNINDGAGSVVQTMQQSEYLNTTIGPAQFALEMVKAPEEISFTSPSP